MAYAIAFSDGSTPACRAEGRTDPSGSLARPDDYRSRSCLLVIDDNPRLPGISRNSANGRELSKMWITNSEEDRGEDSIDLSGPKNQGLPGLSA